MSRTVEMTVVQNGVERTGDILVTRFCGAARKDGGDPRRVCITSPRAPYADTERRNLLFEGTLEEAREFARVLLMNIERAILPDGRNL